MRCSSTSWPSLVPASARHLPCTSPDGGATTTGTDGSTSRSEPIGPRSDSCLRSTESTGRCGYQPGWRTISTPSVLRQRAGGSLLPKAVPGRWTAGGCGASTAGPKPQHGQRVRTTATTRRALRRTTRRAARFPVRIDAGGDGVFTPGVTMPPATNSSSSGSTQRTSRATWGIATATRAGSCTSVLVRDGNSVSRARRSRQATPAPSLGARRPTNRRRIAHCSPVSCQRRSPGRLGPRQAAPGDGRPDPRVGLGNGSAHPILANLSRELW